MTRRDDIVIIGAGPAGLTAAMEILRRTDRRPVILEADAVVGGLSRTVRSGDRRMDIGGHRFFSKNEAVMDWWLDVLPLQGAPASDEDAGQSELTPGGPDPEQEDAVMLRRSRRSRICFDGKLLPYPLKLDAATLLGLGLLPAADYATGYLRAKLAPRPEQSLADFFINRFGGELYRAFFRDYTAKVWGTLPTTMRPDWGAQRIRGLSLAEVIRHALRRRGDGSLTQRDIATSLIERFLYPKFGPGQLWETVADRVRAGGGLIHHHARVDRLHLTDGRITAVESVDPRTDERCRWPASAVISTMPVDMLVAGLGDAVPSGVRRLAAGLRFRSFVAIGVVVRHFMAQGAAGPARDNWLYIQDRRVKLGRIQLFRNWSPYLVDPAIRDDPTRHWLGLEYFCDAGDAFWTQDDAAIVTLAERELSTLGFSTAGSCTDGVVVRMARAYPTYGGTHHRFAAVRGWLDTIDNLFLAGRNGMHRYNNMDHSMLAAMAAVDCIMGNGTRDALWGVNADQDYHEERRR